MGFEVWFLPTGSQGGFGSAEWAAADGTEQRFVAATAISERPCHQLLAVEARGPERARVPSGSRETFDHTTRGVTFWLGCPP
jgi:hypothetical protein